MKKEQITDGFKFLGIEKKDLPDYKDPYSFSKGFKICSILDSAPSVKTNTTACSSIEEI